MTWFIWEQRSDKIIMYAEYLTEIKNKMYNVIGIDKYRTGEPEKKSSQYQAGNFVRGTGEIVVWQPDPMGRWRRFI